MTKPHWRSQSNIRLVLAKELRDLWQGGKIAVGAALALIIVPLTTLALLTPFFERVEELRQSANLLKLADPGADPYSAIRFHGFRVPSITEIFNEGVAPDFPAQFSLPRNASADPVARQVFDRPFLNSLPSNDLRFIFQLLFPLVAVALSFAMVSGEREAGTLALLCSHSIARRSIVVGKLLAGAIVLAGLLLLAHLAAGLTITLAGAAIPSGFWSFLALHCAASFLWTLLFLLLGIVASAALPSSNQAAMLLLAAWATLVLVVPAALPSLATSSTNYTSEQRQYEDIWPHGARMFAAAQDWASEMQLSFSEGILDHFARQPAWSEVGLSLSSKRWRAKLFCVSDGTVVVRSEEEPLLRALEKGLPALIRRQDEAGGRVSEIRSRRFARLLEESERLNAISVLAPTSAYNQITASLAGSDAVSYLAFIQELNERKENYFTSLRSLSDFHSRRFFADPGHAESSSGLGPAVWERRDDVRSPIRSRLGAWLALLAENLFLALAAAALFCATPPK